ncbi:transposase [Komagataeibacter medellinensis NBRC 3288]|uniref:Transposase n=1 Tax=Komagataeibacter medellinensis (strain NBRC 3288 / BCRC 11682 / LMG 1693 / Kondo 51) TaxID=634177 RepID=G2I2G7_KOMMN|nr:transposase [Komagataeibacter medellinensis NBRC 3288]
MGETRPSWTPSKNFLTLLNPHTGHLLRGKRIEIWLQDEARIGQKNGVVRQEAKRATRQRYANACLFGAICPA